MRTRYMHFLFLLFLAQSCSQKPNEFLITDFGAAGDGKTLNTNAIKKAIDKASVSGGTVIVPPGKFLTGSVFLKSNITFEIQSGGELLGSPHPEDYPFLRDSTVDDKLIKGTRHLIIISNAENVTLKGEGTINGQGWNFWQTPENPFQWVRAKDRPDAMLMVLQSKNVSVRDLHLVNPPNWTGDIHSSQKVHINGITINNNLRSPNSDGFDISGSKEVIISDCNISTCDDAIVLNAAPGDVNNVTVSNCIIRTMCAAIKIGWPGDRHNISNVAVSNCAIWESNRGIAIYQSYGITQNVTVSNIVYESNAAIVFIRPIQIDLRRGRDTTSSVGAIRNISISNFIATTQGRILITAEPGAFIENLSLTDIHLQYTYFEDPGIYARNPTSDQASNKSPEARVAKAAIVVENVKGLWVNNVMIKWPGKEVPTEWKLDNKIENGSVNIHHPDYSTARPVEFSVFWGKGIERAFINAPLAESSCKGLEKFYIRNSTGINSNQTSY